MAKKERVLFIIFVPSLHFHKKPAFINEPQSSFGSMRFQPFLVSLRSLDFHLSVLKSKAQLIMQSICNMLK